MSRHRPEPTILDRLQVGGLKPEIVAAFRRRAQKRGEVATQDTGRPVSVATDDTSPATTLPDIGVTRDDAHRKRRECHCAVCEEARESEPPR